MKRLIVVVLAIAVATAQEKEAKVVESGPRVQKIFQVKYANVDNLWNAFQSIATVRVDRTLGVLAVSGSPEAVAAIEDALKRLDVPPAPAKNTELTFHMILASPAANGSLPSDLASVQRNLESLFGFKGYKLMETAVFRARNGERVEASGYTPNPANAAASEKLSYSVRADPRITASSAGNVVRIDNLRLHLRIPYAMPAATPSFQYRDASINTQIDIKEGQKVVVGKANVDGSDGALILVVTAKVVE
jgi:hypothetical protein